MKSASKQAQALAHLGKIWHYEITPNCVTVPSGFGFLCLLGFLFIIYAADTDFGQFLVCQGLEERSSHSSPQKAGEQKEGKICYSSLLF